MSTSAPVSTLSKIGPVSTNTGGIRRSVSQALENASLSATLSSSVGKPRVMFLRLPPKMLASTRNPLATPGMSSNTTAGALSEWLTSSVAMPISSAQPAPRTVFTSPSRSASASHVRRSS